MQFELCIINRYSSNFDPMEYSIENPIQEKIEELLDLCEAHAAFEKSKYDRFGKNERLLQDIWGPVPKLNCLVAISDGRYIGYITWMEQYSTWDAKEYLYMDCLYLMSDFRGFGIGEALVDEMKAFGSKENIELIQWQTPDFNVRAIKFYKRIGAYSKTKERFYLPIK